VPGKDVLQYYWRPISAINLNCNTNVFFEHQYIVLAAIITAITYIYIYEYTVDSSSYYSIPIPDIEAALLIAINHDQS
jgi:hypothetical protein